MVIRSLSVIYNKKTLKRHGESYQKIQSSAVKNININEKSMCESLASTIKVKSYALNTSYEEEMSITYHHQQAFIKKEKNMMTQGHKAISHKILYKLSFENYYVLKCDSIYL